MITKLCKNDIKEYLNLISHLSQSEYSEYILTIFNNLELNNKTILVYKQDNKIVGTGSIFIEYKLSHSGYPVGHIEDVVVLPDYRKMGIGKLIVNELINIARTKLCYKIILSCNDNNIKFYKDCGFKLHEVTMRMDI